jgi:hypothetical protein
MNLVMSHAIANLSNLALMTYVGMALRVIQAMTAAVHNVSTGLCAFLEAHLILVHANASQSRLALKISA